MRKEADSRIRLAGQRNHTVNFRQEFVLAYFEPWF
jgi:hypothetical protein